MSEHLHFDISHFCFSPLDCFEPLNSLDMFTSVALGASYITTLCLAFDQKMSPPSIYLPIYNLLLHIS